MYRVDQTHCVLNLFLNKGWYCKTNNVVACYTQTVAQDIKMVQLFSIMAIYRQYHYHQSERH
jgi:hypothetical protein